MLISLEISQEVVSQIKESVEDNSDEGLAAWIRNAITDKLLQQHYNLAWEEIALIEALKRTNPSEGTYISSADLKSAWKATTGSTSKETFESTLRRFISKGFLVDGNGKRGSGYIFTLEGQAAIARRY